MWFSKPASYSVIGYSDYGQIDVDGHISMVTANVAGDLKREIANVNDKLGPQFFVSFLVCHSTCRGVEIWQSVVSCSESLSVVVEMSNRSFSDNAERIFVKIWADLLHSLDKSMSSRAAKEQKPPPY